MPPDVAPRLRMTPSEYLDWERRQPTKHEYVRGEVFAMAGGSPRRNFLSAAASGELRAALTSTACRVLSSDQRIAASDGARYMYSDAVVVCGGVRIEAGTNDVLANPAIVVEVLSASTESYDRGDKWEAYQRVSSLTDYLLLSQSSVRVSISSANRTAPGVTVCSARAALCSCPTGRASPLMRFTPERLSSTRADGRRGLIGDPADAAARKKWHTRDMSSPAPTQFSPAEYLAIERAGERKHECVAGAIVAMAGARPPHNMLSANIISALVQLCRPGPGVTMTSDQRVFVPATKLYAYPTPRLHTVSVVTMTRIHRACGE